ncbi:hypothetical protein J3F83DRAFT_730710 [Trichoderma novae-zelandiae]
MQVTIVNEVKLNCQDSCMGHGIRIRLALMLRPTVLHDVLRVISALRGEIFTPSISIAISCNSFSENKDPAETKADNMQQLAYRIWGGYSIDNITRFFRYSHINLCSGIFIICCRWIIHDNYIRQNYHQAIGDAVDDILQRIRTGEMSPETGAQKEHQMRNQFFCLMRHKTSPIGLLVAHSIHATTRPYKYYLEKNALFIFGKPSTELSLSQATEVAMNTICSAKRPSNAVTAMSKRASLFCKGTIIAVVASSVFSASMSEHRAIDLTRLVALGSCFAAVGNLGIGTTNVYMLGRGVTDK